MKTATLGAKEITVFHIQAERLAALVKDLYGVEIVEEDEIRVIEIRPHEISSDPLTKPVFQADALRLLVRDRLVRSGIYLIEP